MPILSQGAREESITAPTSAIASIYTRLRFYAKIKEKSSVIFRRMQMKAEEFLCLASAFPNSC